jgi:hypothetical protein
MCIAFGTNIGDKNTLSFVNFQNIIEKMKEQIKK